MSKINLHELTEAEVESLLEDARETQKQAYKIGDMGTALKLHNNINHLNGYLYNRRLAEACGVPVGVFKDTPSEIIEKI